MTAFVKMHGLGNDFAIFDARPMALAMPPARIRLLADRRRGIGCDQLIVLEPSSQADLFMRIYSPDGSESGACGNATRCVAALTGARRIETRAGMLQAERVDDAICVNMGQPSFAWEEIPLAYAMDTLALPLAWEGLEHPTAVSMGNPHAVFLVEDVDTVALEAIGPQIEHDPIFPERVNVNVASLQSPSDVRLRLWGRDTGLTLACGSGACATFAALRRRRLIDPIADIHMPGGTLTIAEQADGSLTMTGAVTTSFTGETSL